MYIFYDFRDWVKSGGTYHSLGFLSFFLSFILRFLFFVTKTQTLKKCVVFSRFVSNRTEASLPRFLKIKKKTNSKTTKKRGGGRETTTTNHKTNSCCCCCCCRLWVYKLYSFWLLLLLFALFCSLTWREMVRLLLRGERACMRTK